MRLFKKTPPEQTRRQRVASQSERPSSPSFSYYARRRSEDPQPTGRILRREALAPAAKHFGGFWLQRFGLAILLIVAVVCLVSVLTLSTNPRIVELSVSGSTSYLHQSSVYQQAAAKLLASSILNHNKITVDTARVNARLQAEFPELDSVSVTLPLLAHRPVIYLQPARPALILDASSGSYVISTSGKALLRADKASAVLSSLSLPVVTDQSGLQVKLDHEALTGTNVAFIQTVVAQLAAKSIQLGAMVLPAGASELDVHLAGQPYFVKFNLENNDARQQVGTFLAVHAKLTGQNIAPAQYIDVRVDGRAYYQ